jgi:hypothetical protein
VKDVISTEVQDFLEDLFLKGWINDVT